MLKQVYTHLQSLEMCEVSKGIIPVLHLSIHRHAGDHDAGNQDSWFINVVAEGTSTEGNKCPLMFILKGDHGWTKEVCAGLAGRILLVGEIDLKHWIYCCNH
jgi:hypothetical protein